jgi:hypothetical protein
MTTAIIKSINRSDLIALHSMYVALHRANKVRPKLFTYGYCTTIVTALMSNSQWAWRVVGITPAALQRYKEQGFKVKSNQGIKRAHLRQRISTTEVLLASKKPLPETTFIKTLLRHDRTVLCIKGENRHPVPKYIPFANQDASLFSSQKIAFRHATKEEALLRRLYTDKYGRRRVKHREITAKSATRNTNAKSELMTKPRTSTKRGARTATAESIDKTNKKAIRKVKGERGSWPAVHYEMTTEQRDMARRKRDKVRVDGNLYGSVYKAFVALHLPVEQHEAFRGDLKHMTRLPFTLKGRAYEFEIAS